MRSASEFNAYYQSPDPWAISKARQRDRALAAIVEPYVFRKTVLELGCGEGYLTSTLFRNARSIEGIDISTVAISRAQARFLPNASFKSADFLNISFKGYDVIAAIECLYYLSSIEQED